MDLPRSFWPCSLSLQKGTIPRPICEPKERMTLLRVVIAVLLGALSGFAQAQSKPDLYTGHWLYEQYAGFKNEVAPGSLLFAAYVSGVVDAQLTRKATAGAAAADWCAPSGTVMSRYFDVVGRYLEENPLERSRHRAVLVTEALSKTWPCVR
jgi:Rap1a immunity proteins